MTPTKMPFFASKPGSEWGRLTWLRDRLARRIAGPAAPAPEAPPLACTIVKLDRIGDFVLATGAIRQLVEHFGESRCALVVSQEAAALAAREFPDVIRCPLPADAGLLFREIAPRRRGWQASLGALGCEHLVCLRHQRSFYRDLVLRAIPARRQWRLQDAPFSDRAILTLPPGTARYPTASEMPDRPREIAAHRRLLASVFGRDVAEREVRPELRPMPAEASDGTVVVAPLASNRLRNLREKIVWETLAGCAALADAAVTLIGSAAQSSQLEAFRESAPPAWRARCRIAAGEPLERWAGRIAGARLTIAADSGPAHVACALDRPLIATTGGGHHGLFTPWSRSSRQRWLEHAMPCYGCNWSCIHPEAYCLTHIDASAFIAAAHAVLEGDSPG